MYIVRPLLRLIPKKFLSNDDGAITVEAVLWVPVYLVFFALITDVSLMFHGYSKALQVAQDTNRHASTGYYIEEDALEKMAKENLSHFSPNAKVAATLDLSAAVPLVTTTISMPAGDLQAVGLFAVFANINIEVTSVHLLEI